MTKRTGFLILMIVLLGGLYARNFTDWFAPKVIQIGYRSMDRGSGPVLTFLLGKEHKLTAVKVFSRGESKTNQTGSLFWHLVAKDKTSHPVSSIDYGQPVPGMKPMIPQAQARPLDPTQTYLIVVESEKIRGQREFKTRGSSENAF